MPRIGLGYDSHRFVAGRPLMLGGVLVAHDMGLAGHSDADAALHAITDAILGALGLGDIGEHFPDGDPKWRNADSRHFVLHAVQLAHQHGMKVGNCDLTIITESPKLRAAKPLMKASIAEMLGVPQSAVAVKAKTNEHMGWIGRGEGLAAMAVVMLVEQTEIG
ncbi:MAG: 2-C-methyl-D-erythritol 2,4-cyclodiphosphate synthase [Planctomycetaceae bacterium]|nr:MAG: 2-C-methyl-D-erythritol 2,4-cyclodiphosphate synthase [Planctomycetaceae bacterium]